VFAQKCNLKDGGISLEQARFLDPSTVSKWDDIYKLQTGDILVNSTGTGTVGRTRLFDVTCLGSYPFVVPDSHVSVIRTSNQINSNFIFAYISSKFIQQYLEENLAGSTNQKELYIGVLSTLRIPIPSFTEQERIVAEIEKWFALIDQIEQKKGDLQATIKQTRSKILDLAIHGKLVPQNPADEPASELLKRINPAAEITCDNGQYGKIPNRWTTIKIGDAANYINGRAFKPEEWMNEGTPIIRIQNLNDKTASYNYSTQLFESKYLIKNGDLLFAWAASLGTYIWDGEDAWLNQHIFKIEPKPFVTKEYLYCIFKAMISEFYNQSHGSGMVHITKKQFENIILFLPPLAEQHRIVTKIGELFAYLDNIQKSLEA
jgi:type I restriction enzyme S subunit